MEYIIEKKKKQLNYAYVYIYIYNLIYGQLCHS